MEQSNLNSVVAKAVINIVNDIYPDTGFYLDDEEQVGNEYTKLYIGQDDTQLEIQLYVDESSETIRGVSLKYTNASGKKTRVQHEDVSTSTDLLLANIEQ